MPNPVLEVSVDFYLNTAWSDMCSLELRRHSSDLSQVALTVCCQKAKTADNEASKMYSKLPVWSCEVKRKKKRKERRHILQSMTAMTAMTV